MTDTEGYGPRPGQSDLERLLEDCRTLSPLGVERVAKGWDRFASGPLNTEYHEAEQTALHVVESSGRIEEWDRVRSEILGLTEFGQPLVAWRVEHGEVGHKAENALLGAALALVAGRDLDPRHRQILLRPMADALPWLPTHVASV